MEFRVLGPLEVSGHAGPLRLGPRKQRALLARLLLDAGRTVAVERLLDDLWGDRLPDSAPKMVQIYVSGLRKALPKGMLETRPPGYVLHVEPGACDLDRFERLALDGRAALEAGDAPLAATRLGEALALWRGPALAEFTAEPFAAGEAMRLEELRLECVEQRIDAELALGHHTSVIGDLEALTRRHPLRERLHGQLILALYRAARQAEALAAYQAFRARLDDELGIEPSPALRELERAVLLQEPGLAAARAAAAPSSPPAPRPAETLPGRERELACLQRALDAARGGQSRVVVITGEPGIGKRALLDAFLDRAGDTLVAHGEAHGRADAYAPLLDALGRLADDEAVAATLAARAPAWLAHMPWLAGRGAGEPHGVTGERMVRQLIDALEHVAVERPVVLAVEDLEQADGATRELLGALARRRSPTRLLVVLTYAPGPAAEPLARDLRELCLAGHADLVTLGRLDPAAVAARLAARFPAAEPPPGVARLLWERAGGHPLLDRLLVDHWLSAGLIGDAGGRLVLTGPLEDLGAGVPAGLRGLIADRLAVLDPADADLLQAAAVAGPAFDAGALAVALARPTEEVEARSAALDSMLEPGVAGRWRFSHPLAREAVLELVAPAERARLHRRIGEALEGRAAPAEAAHHLLEGGDPGQAARFLREAADIALARRAYDDGIAHLRTALTAAASLPDDPERRRLEVELGARLGQALVATSGWSAPDAEAVLARARTLARATHDNELVVSVSLALATLWEVRGDSAAAGRAADEALALADGGDGPRLDAHELLACSHFHQGAFARALQHAELGASLFDPTADGGHYDSFPATLGDNAGLACLAWAALAAWFLGEPDTALERARHAVALAHEPGRAYALAPALTQLAVVHQLRREPADVLREAEATIAAARDRGYAYRTAMGRVLRGWALSMLGAADEGLTEIVGGVAAARATGAHMEDPYFLALLADAQLEVGDVRAGLRAVDEGLRVARREHSGFCDPELRRLRAGLRRAGGADARTVEAELLEALATARRQHSRVLELRVAVDLASLQREEDLPADGPRLVAEVYETFREGFATPDLREAAALMRARPLGESRANG